MQPIKVKIGQSAGSFIPDSGRVVKLRNQDASTEIRRQKVASRRIWPWVLLFFIILEAGAIAFLYFTRPSLPYEQIMPDKPAAVVYFNISSAGDLLTKLKDQGYAWQPFVWGREALAGFLTKNQPFSLAEARPLFEDKAVFLVLGHMNDKQVLAWLALLTVKAPKDVLNDGLNRIEAGFKSNYQLSDDYYRQVKITMIEKLGLEKKAVYYAMAGKYLIISNTLDAAKLAIDKIAK